MVTTYITGDEKYELSSLGRNMIISSKDKDYYLKGFLDPTQDIIVSNKPEVANVYVDKRGVRKEVEFYSIDAIADKLLPSAEVRRRIVAEEITTDSDPRLLVTSPIERIV